MTYENRNELLAAFLRCDPEDLTLLDNVTFFWDEMLRDWAPANPTLDQLMEAVMERAVDILASDIEEELDWLQGNPDEASRIARLERLCPEHDIIFSCVNGSATAYIRYHKDDYPDRYITHFKALTGITLGKETP